MINGNFYDVRSSSYCLVPSFKNVLDGEKNNLVRNYEDGFYKMPRMSLSEGFLAWPGRCCNVVS